MSNAEVHKRIAEEAWQRGLHMRDTEVAELREQNGRLAREAIGAKAAWDEVRAENERLTRDVNIREIRMRQAEARQEAAEAENERLRAALEEALEKATACAPVDRLHELEPLWAVLDRSNCH